MMKQFSTCSPGFALQVFAVILIFGYPGFSSKKKPEEINKDKTGFTVGKNSSPAKGKKNNFINAGDSSYILYQWPAVKTKYSSFTDLRK
jgi:hypothetical protein